MGFILWVGFLSIVTAGVTLAGNQLGWDGTATIHTVGALVAVFGFTALARSSGAHTLVMGMLCLSFGLVVGFADPFSLQGIALWLVLAGVPVWTIADQMEDLPRDQKPFYPKMLVFGAVGGTSALTLLAPHWREYESTRFILVAIVGTVLLLASLVFSRKFHA
ncbi:MAG: hypothetical protein QOE22_626 [Candidatus Parcubacteria bacterium]|jgi:hypothetical protein|nr:hypothetical protein [Candidatus Parcubacteria bacterium]